MGWKGILGFDYGVVQAPLGPDVSGPELVAAVANAGAIGILRAPDWVPPPLFSNLNLVSDCDIPVIAAGGIVDARGYVAALVLGARGPKEVRRFAGTVPNSTTTGNVDCMAMYAGEGVGLINEILPAGEVVKSLVEEAQHIIQQKFSHD
ncbi:hypothetical protein GW17_00057452 [Ensete ventricosum]|nr:hypothetical protein GW17_00057452 [Ensete ventricosum]